MPPRQTIPQAWRILISPTRAQLSNAIVTATRGSGILIIGGARIGAQAKLLARQRHIALAMVRPRLVARVHDPRELRSALLSRTPMVLLSPLNPTATHPDWPPLPRMRAASLARLAGRRLIALGGMGPRAFRRIRGLGFEAWAGISAFRT